jgi:hypothetical protein
MHDYGTKVWLEDVESGKVLTQVAAERDAEGKLVKVKRKLFGVSGDGLRLKSKRRYRVVGEYDNPTGETLVKGAMASMVGLFVPDDMGHWPAIDPNDQTYRRDLASLEVRGQAGTSTPASHHGGASGAAGSHGAEERVEETGESPQHGGHESHE